MLPRLVANKPLPLYNVVAGKLLTFSIYLMLCVMGYQLGVNDSLLESIPKVGAKALYISLLGMVQQKARIGISPLPDNCF